MYCQQYINNPVFNGDSMNDFPTPMLSEMGYVYKLVSTQGMKRMPNYTNGYISWRDYSGKIVTLADLMEIVHNMTFAELEELARR